MLPVPGADQLRLRLPRLMLGLFLFGVGLAFMVVSDLGLAPWEVLHQGISRHTGVLIGTVGILTGFLVLLAWIPIGERFGIGTVLNVVTIGIVVDVTLAVLPDRIDSVAIRWGALLTGIVMIVVGSGFYIGAGLGPGPRDGLMTGIARRGHRLGVVRTVIEVAALAGGWVLGGTVGVGTALFAIGIGPIVEVSMRHLAVAPLPERDVSRRI